MTTPRRDRKRKGSPQWVRLGEQLAGRRADLSPDYEGHGGRAAFARDRDVNLKLIQDIELNARENFTPRTLRDVIAPAYGVTYESIRRALEGGELDPLESPAGDSPMPPATPEMDALMSGPLEEIEALFKVARRKHPGQVLTGEMVFPFGPPLFARYWDKLIKAGWKPEHAPAGLAYMVTRDAEEEAEAEANGTAAGLSRAGIAALPGEP